MAENAYLLELNPSETVQGNQHTSFIGGKPCLPAAMPLPICKLCGAQQTFFFQIAFPADHLWSGLSLAVFACADCAHEDHTIPEMLKGTLRDANIPERFLERYQMNFRLLIVETGIMRQDYQERIRFAAWELVKAEDSAIYGNKVGGQPAWVLENEAPATYADEQSMIFLAQIVEDFEFDIHDHAPQQKRLFEFPKMQRLPFYRLFNANALYFFGTTSREHPLVYVITQTD